MYIYHRDETRGQKMVKAMRDVGFDLKIKIKKVNLNDQILVVNSSLIGDTAKDIHSFYTVEAEVQSEIFANNQKLTTLR